MARRFPIGRRLFRALHNFHPYAFPAVGELVIELEQGELVNELVVIELEQGELVQVIELVVCSSADERVPYTG